MHFQSFPSFIGLKVIDGRPGQRFDSRTLKISYRMSIFITLFTKISNLRMFCILLIVFSWVFVCEVLKLVVRFKTIPILSKMKYIRKIYHVSRVDYCCFVVQIFSRFCSDYWNGPVSGLNWPCFVCIISSRESRQKLWNPIKEGLLPQWLSIVQIWFFPILGLSLPPLILNIPS
jgi:hypothetical protein